MTLLQQDPDAKGGEQRAATPPEAPPAAPACPKCHTELSDGQDWCLTCGQAQPGRLSNLPGKRAAATVLALTTVLVGGAVAASYAALQDGSAAPGATPTQVAQATAAGPADAVVPPADPSAALPAQPTTSAPADATPLPDTGAATATPAPATPAPTPASPSPSSTSGTKTTPSTSKNSSSKADTRTSTTPTETAPVAIKLDPSAAAPYDPYTRNTATGGDPAKMLDGDPGTSFPITVAPGSGAIAAGVTVDVGKQQGLREIDLSTKTPGFKVEVYATDSDELPPDVLDTRWAHLKDVPDVGAGAGNKQIISLGSGTSKYRHVLLWFTVPPTDGLTVRVSELKLLG